MPGCMSNTVRTMYSFVFKQKSLSTSPHSLCVSVLEDCQNKGDAGEVGGTGLCSDTGRTG